MYITTELIVEREPRLRNNPLAAVDQDSLKEWRYSSIFSISKKETDDNN